MKIKNPPVEPEENKENDSFLELEGIDVLEEVKKSKTFKAVMTPFGKKEETKEPPKEEIKCQLVHCSTQYDVYNEVVDNYTQHDVHNEVANTYTQYDPYNEAVDSYTQYEQNQKDFS